MTHFNLKWYKNILFDISLYESSYNGDESFLYYLYNSYFSLEYNYYIKSWHIWI